MSGAHDDLLAQEFQFYLDHQEELLQQYDGRVIVIKGRQVIGDYDSDAMAITETRKTHGMGTFLVQRVTAGQEAYTQTFHSRVRG